jgi:predicted transcriptional regulator
MSSAPPTSPDSGSGTAQSHGGGRQAFALRSLLFVPGNRETMLRKAAATRPDVFVPDLEDSVPADEKVNARETVRRSVGMARRLMEENKISGIPIVEGRRVVGILTSRDLRFRRDENARIADVMTRNPKTIRADELAVAAVEKMETLKINGLLVVDEANTLVGALNMHDLLKAGVV